MVLCLTLGLYSGSRLLRFNKSDQSLCLSQGRGEQHMRRVQETYQPVVLDSPQCSEKALRSARDREPRVASSLRTACKILRPIKKGRNNLIHTIYYFESSIGVFMQLFRTFNHRNSDTNIQFLFLKSTKRVGFYMSAFSYLSDGPKLNNVGVG